MRYIKFAGLLLLLGAGILFFNTHHPLGSSLPAIGKLLNPFTGFWQNAEAAGPGEDYTLTLEGLEQKVEVIFDERMVPHIFAQDIEDAAFAQGYITAMHRLWQMDISVRSISGRLSEVLGEQTLDYDRRQRRLGFMQAGKNALKGWNRNPGELAMIQAYAEGVNAYVATLSPADYPVEYKLLGYAPETWTPLHSALFFKNMAYTLCFRHDDLGASNMRAVFGEELFGFLYPEYMPGQSPVIPEEVAWSFDTIAINPPMPATLVGQALPYEGLPQPPPYVGSNNWAVSGSKTASGNPILSNDPHLRLTLPSIWYEIQIQTPEMNAYGVSLPGVPGIIIGFNEHITWGVTNVGQDVLDWYALTWLNEEKTRYLIDDQPQEIQIVRDTITVRGQTEPVVEETKYTEWGPVVYESADHPYRDFALRWIAHDVPEKKSFYELGAFYRLMKARNHADYEAALHGYESPAQNFAFASREGDIALRVNGKFPLKRRTQGRFMQDGSLSANGWQGFIPMDQIPQVKNPERGFVSSANQHSTAPSYPYYYNGSFDEYRGRYINRRLAEMDSITVEDMMALQQDNFSLLPEEAAPVLLRYIDSLKLNEAERRVAEVLRNWDYRFEQEAVAPVYFQALLDSVYRHTFDEHFALQDSMEVLMPDNWRLVDMLQQYSTHPLFDHRMTSERESALDIVQRALREVAVLTSEGGDLAGQSWSTFKNTNIQHLGRIAAFSSGYVPSGGYKEAPNAITRGNGPSWRMVVEMGEEVKAYGVYPGGQSGNPGSPYYDNALDDWAAGNYNRLFLMNNPADTSQPSLFSVTMRKK